MRAMAMGFWSVAHAVYCGDKSPECPTLAAGGACTGKGSELVQRSCPLSCGLCARHGCNDTHPECPFWATAGQCDANPAYMARTCPTSCGLCTPICAGENRECQEWAQHSVEEFSADGFALERKFACQSDAEFMFLECPITCGACRRVCMDQHDECDAWAAAGHCVSEPVKMLRECAFSCNLCGGHDFYCYEADAEKCRRKAGPGDTRGDNEHYRRGIELVADDWLPSGDCNDAAFAERCPVSCGICSAVCTDHHRECRQWARQGQCESDPARMYKECPAVCGLCRELEHEYNGEACADFDEVQLQESTSSPEPGGGSLPPSPEPGGGSRPRSPERLCSGSTSALHHDPDPQPSGRPAPQVICAKWASDDSNACTVKERYMHALCPKSCGYCIE
jgi:hypothetical protein